MMELADEFVLRSDKAFFEIVSTTADYLEAVDLLRRAKTAVLKEKSAALRKRDTSRDQEMSLLLTKLGVEIRRINEREYKVRWRDAVRDLFGKEGLDAVIAHMEMQRYPDMVNLDGKPLGEPMAGEK